MAVTIKLKRATAARWSEENPVLAEGELGLEKDTGRVKAGDGASHWSSLAYMPTHDHVDQTFVFEQNTPADTWTISHNKGKFLNATVVTSSGQQVEGDVVYQDSDTIVVAFSAAFSGKAYVS